MISISKIIILLMTIYSAITFAQGESENTIPFAKYEIYQQNTVSGSSPANQMSAVRQDKPIKIPSDEISETVKNIRTSVCNSIAPGSVEVWIGIGADAKAVVVNSHFESGIKVSFTCEVQSSGKRKR